MEHESARGSTPPSWRVLFFYFLRAGALGADGRHGICSSERLSKATSQGEAYDFFEIFSKCLDPGSTPGSVGGYLYGGHSGGGEARHIPRHIFCPVLTPNPDQHKYSVHSRITQVPCTVPSSLYKNSPLLKAGVLEALGQSGVGVAFGLATRGSS